MNCTTCHGLCQVNNTGICLGCQRGFVNLPQEDAWINSDDRKKVKLKKRKEELENALQDLEPSSLCKEFGTRKGVRTPYSERKKVAQKS